MQILILAAGESSRFWPFSEICHKSLLKVGEKTLLEQTLEGLKGHEVILVVNKKTTLSDEIIKNNNIKIILQDEPKGMANAIIKSKSILKVEFLLFPYFYDFVFFYFSYPVRFFIPFLVSFNSYCRRAYFN